jgi:hypothetical protein
LGFSSTEALPKTSSRILTPSFDDVSLGSSLFLVSSFSSLLAVVSLSF